MARYPHLLIAIASALALGALTAELAAQSKPTLTLWVRSQTSVQRFHWKQGSLIRAGKVDLSGFPTTPYRRRFPVRLAENGALWLTSDRMLIEVTPSLKPIVRFTAAPSLTLGNFHLGRKRIAVAVGGSLHLLSRRTFGSLSVLRLMASDRKAAHDLRVHKGIAYILDNMFVPLWVFRLDLDAPLKPAVLQRTNFSGTNVHLSQQWLDPAHGLWAVVREQSTLGGMSQRVHVFSMGKQSVQQLAQTTLFDFSRMHGKLTDPRLQHRVLAATSDGRWGLVAQYTTGALLWSRMALTRSGVTLKPVLTLQSTGANWYQAAAVTRRGSVAAVWSGKTLWLISLTGAPRVLLRTVLAEKVQRIALGR